MEDRLDRILQDNPLLDTSHDPSAIHHSAKDIIDHFAQNADPSRNKIHTQYLVGLYKRKAIRQADVSLINSTLGNFDRYKQFLPETHRQLTPRNYPSIQHIADAIQPYLGKAVSVRDAREKIRNNPIDIPGHKLMWQDSNIKVYHVSDKEVSKKLYAPTNSSRPGAFPTKWCTAKEDRNMFDDYHDSANLYSVHDKSGNIYQYYPNGEFKNSDNTDVTPEQFSKIKSSVHKMWSEKPELLSVKKYNTHDRIKFLKTYAKEDTHYNLENETTRVIHGMENPLWDMPDFIADNRDISGKNIHNILDVADKDDSMYSDYVAGVLNSDPHNLDSTHLNRMMAHYDAGTHNKMKILNHPAANVETFQIGMRDKTGMIRNLSILKLNKHNQYQ